MRKKEKDKIFEKLPGCAVEFIKLVIKKMRYRKKVRADVQAELIAHFEDELRDCKSDEEKEQKAQQLINEFGDAKLLGILMRRAKKRCRPLWLKAVNGVCNVLSLVFISFLVLSFIYNAWAAYTWCITKVDYVEIFNQLNRPDDSNGENAWVFYEKALQSYTNVPEVLEEVINNKGCMVTFDNLSKEEKVSLERWLEQNAMSWEYVVEAARTKYYWWNINVFYSEDDDRIENCSQFRNLAKIGIWKARQKTAHNNLKNALGDCITIIRMGKHLIDSKFIYDYLVGRDVISLGEKEIFEIINNHLIDRECLEYTKKELGLIFFDGYPKLDKEGQKIEMSAQIQSTAQGTGDLSKQLWQPYLLFIRWCRPLTEKRTRQFFERVEYQSPFKRNQKGQSPNKSIPSIIPATNIWQPPMEIFMDLWYKRKTTHESLMTVLAVLLFERENVEYPQSLYKLIDDKYLNSIPMDPYSDKPLVYRRTDGGFTLYSVGRNFKDDGGEIFRDKDCIRLWCDEGDAVFWPVSGN